MANRQKSSLRLEKGSWRLEAKTTAGILLVLTILGLLSWLCLTQASKVFATDYRVREKTARKARIQRENAALLAEALEMASVPRLENIALGLGYIYPVERRYLTISGHPAEVAGGGLAVASRPDESAVVAMEEPRDESLGVAGWWQKVVSQFVAWAGTQPR
ncbi:MAG: hypothetical protein H8E47_10070 [Anaerolineales bacterium]|nr:hypothetical protein [Anaerolineales bacterium]